MSSFTGPELGALIDTACIIAAHQAFTDELERQMLGMPEALIRESHYRCWTNGVYLITKVEPLDKQLEIPIGSAASVPLLQERIGPDLRLRVQNQTLRLAPGAALTDVPRERLSEALAERLEAPFEPFSLNFDVEPPPGIGDDHVTAVNIGRPMGSLSHRQRMEVEAAFAQVCADYPSAARLVSVEHFAGGPCHASRLVSCVAYGGTGRGWTCVESGLASAIRLAYSRACLRSPEQGDVRGGQVVRLHGLRARPELNGQMGIALRFLQESGRWEVRLPDGDGCALRAANLQPHGDGGRVLAFWGDAQWSRTQLLGELARGNWGMCRASVSDLIAPVAERRGLLEGRLLYAPVSDMTDSFIRTASEQMEAERARNQMAGAAAAVAAADDGDDRREVERELAAANPSPEP